METRTQNHRSMLAAGRRAGAGDPAVLALLQLLLSERDEALTEDPGMVETQDPGRLWLLWFAIGATVEVCNLVQRDSDSDRNAIFQQVVRAIFDGRNRGGTDGHAYREAADRERIEAFESAGAEAIRACLRGETRLGYYRDALSRMQLSPDRA
jgi:hypothetical protein